MRIEPEMVAIGLTAGVASSLFVDWAKPRVHGLRLMFSPEQSRWSPDDATGVEIRLNKRLGNPYPRRIASDPAAYSAWRADLARTAIKRLLKDAKLRFQRRAGEGALIWGQLTVGERRLLLRSVRDHLLKGSFGDGSPKQLPHERSQGDDLGGLDRGYVEAVNHSDLSVGLHAGDDAESSAGETSPTIERRAPGMSEDIRAIEQVGQSDNARFVVDGRGSTVSPVIMGQIGPELFEPKRRDGDGGGQ